MVVVRPIASIVVVRMPEATAIAIVMSPVALNKFLGVISAFIGTGQESMSMTVMRIIVVRVIVVRVVAMVVSREKVALGKQDLLRGFWLQSNLFGRA